ncbi:MAG: hypothetical protein KDE27_02640 [Planctomycetes bacterium]|nr:hypothetical protein [Planctomycetota bacterium]
MLSFPSVLLAALIAVGGSSTALLPTSAAVAAAPEFAVTDAELEMTITLDPIPTITITGSGYPPDSTVVIGVMNENTNETTAIEKETDSEGNILPSSTPIEGTIAGSPGDTITAWTADPDAIVSEVVPQPTVTTRIISALRVLIGQH